MKKALIPDFTGKRWLKIGLRTLHLIGFAGVFATALNEVPQPEFWLITIVSGLGLLALEAMSNFIWFVQVRGFVIYLKMGLLFALYVLPEYALIWLILIITISGVISHAPSSIRYYSFIHGRKVTSLKDTKG
ncbi:hypothetical protein GCM10022277_11460 [Litoribacillus peritrichatus]|uniref:Uncharacterized protein n=2 Tax=Litoribacillus peritrichatus TaxID=718191 RepID=A0ABP7MB15_9GAMM